MDISPTSEFCEAYWRYLHGKRTSVGRPRLVGRRRHDLARDMREARANYETMAAPAPRAEFRFARSSVRDTCVMTDREKFAAQVDHLADAFSQVADAPTIEVAAREARKKVEQPNPEPRPPPKRLGLTDLKRAALERKAREAAS
jgi:hypothetical protein